MSVPVAAAPRTPGIMAGAPVLPDRLPSLTSLRWFAASAVFLSHANRLFDGTSLAPVFARIAPQGACGVSFFFILSGFVLAWSHRTGNAALPFYRRRFARVFPAYWAMCVVALIVPPLTYNPIESTHDLLTRLAPLTLLQSWIPSRPFYFGGNSVSWSLSTEVFFYAMFPLLTVPLTRLDQRRRLALIAGLVAAAILVPVFVDNLWVTFIDPVFRLVEFVLGICLCGLLGGGVRRRFPVAAAGALALAAYVAASWAPERLMLSAVTLVPFAILIFAVAQAEIGGRPARTLRSTALIHLGQWSYSFYLVHALVISTVVHAAAGVHGGGPLLVALAAAYGIAIVSAYVLFRVVEHPLELRLRGGGTAMPRAELASPPAR